MKQMKNHNFYDNCMLCPRTCGAQRSKGKTGICGVTETLKVARAALQCYLMPDETALRELSEGVIEKLKLLTDAEFAELEFPPD